MRAKRIIEYTGGFNPEETARLQASFNAAWNSVRPLVRPALHSEARETLATIVISIVNVRMDLDTEEIAPAAVGIFLDIHAAKFAIA